MKKTLFVIMLSVLLIAGCQSETPTPTLPTATIEITVAPTQEATIEPTPYETVTVKMNSSKIMSYAPIFIAEKEGFFEDFGKCGLDAVF